MSTDDPYVKALRILCDAEGGYMAVADKTGVNNQTLYQIVKGIKLPSGNPRGVGPLLRKKITAAYPAWMAAAPGRHTETNTTPAPIGERRIPLISYVQAGGWADVADPFAIGDAFEFLLTDLELSSSAFALEIKGDSMLPEFKPGDRVIIDPSIAPLPGDYVVAKNGEDEATFKKYRPRGATERGEPIFELVPLNEDYPSMRSDVVPIRIVGTMVEHRKYRRR